MKVVVNWTRCEGNGACMVEAPAIFDLDDKDMLIVLDETPPEAERKRLEDAVASCPRRALSIED